MFDNNGHEPILSETEIRFLLSDQPISAKRISGPARDKTKGMEKNAKRKDVDDNLIASPRDPR
ncbi:hypothetical protein BerOc1_00455 [Pseudodesulfovibrio hydrargyri]|uniref:Uncharacterized protein n=1 Tax=Pseudodesulfovibrio hydrargyri TaxID=2125990 RepID=A0A1J5N8N1_9BACT|nr:hypothetical protein [Pseudodesulfovibrio hydrargyri]OIQ51987.1 hypothetical protein BerOc1_00455 [Pseudodesulfovibrio hydrargyri]